MFLTASKRCLRHLNCESPHKNKEGVFDWVKVALEKAIGILTDCKPNREIDISSITIYIEIKEFKLNTETLWKNLYFQSKENLLWPWKPSWIIRMTLLILPTSSMSTGNASWNCQLMWGQTCSRLISVWIQAQSKKTVSVAEDWNSVTTSVNLRTS